MTEEEKKEDEKAEAPAEEKTEQQKAAEQAAKEMQESIQKAPTGIKILAFLYIIGGIMWFIWPLITSFHVLFNPWDLIPPDWTFLDKAAYLTCCWIGSIIIAMLYFGIAGGLIKGMQGAWLWAVIFAIFGLFNVPWGTIISLIILVYLFKVKDYFKMEKPQAQ